MTLTNPGGPEGLAPEDELQRCSRAVRHAILQAPGTLPGIWRDIKAGASEEVARTIESRFGPSLRWAMRGENVRRGALVLVRVAAVYSRARAIHRKLFLENAVPTIIALGHAEDQRQLLVSLSQTVRELALVGTAQQLFLADLSIRLGLAPALSPLLHEVLLEPLIAALTLVLELGAPATQDAAIEGLGALIKHREKTFALAVLTPDQLAEGDPAVNVEYEERRRRRELLVLAIAGEPHNRARYFAALEAPGTDWAWRADLLRALPAIWRQGSLDEQTLLRERAIKLLVIAAAAEAPGLDRSASVRAGFARFQQGVSETIDVMLDREVEADRFDRVVAEAVKRIPETLIGSLELSNAQVRSTVAVLCTAARVAARLDDSFSDAALEIRYKNLKAVRTEWANPGIVEGCFRGLPLLLWDRHHNEWTVEALKEVIGLLGTTPPMSDSVTLHAHFFANMSFRQILIALVERMYQQFLEPHDAHPGKTRERHVESSLRALMERPEPKAILAVFQKGAKYNPSSHTVAAMSPVVLSAMALERELLFRAPSLFAEWEHLSNARRLLLTRILAGQLQVASLEREQLAQYRILHRILRRLNPVSKTESERDAMLWLLVSQTDSHVADAAGVDLQDFVAHRSGHLRSGTSAVVPDPNDLPGYVLSMVSNEVSSHLAADIARQVDLNLTRARRDHPNYDFAIPLYQVMLRNPHVAIFHHLLARVTEPDDRAMLLLFRDHVAVVSKCIPRGPDDDERIDQLVAYASTLAPRLWKRFDSRTLRELGGAMETFVSLARLKSDIWEAIVHPRCAPGESAEGGGLGALFRTLDALAEETYVAHHTRQPETQPAEAVAGENPRVDVTGRRSLVELCAADCAQLRLETQHYLRLAVGQFDECGRALNTAIAAAQRIAETIEHRAGLEQPERVILLALIVRLERVLKNTVAWFVDAPRRCVHARQPELFWLTFTFAPDKPKERPAGRIAAALALAEGDLKEAGDILGAETVVFELPNVPQPPRPPGQDLAFEKFYVEWTSAELEVDYLQWALRGRWKWFELIYRLVTTLKATLLTIAAPFGLVILLHRFHREEIEGIGFFLYLIVFAAFTARAMYERRRAERNPAKVGDRPLYPYRFQALLPRLFRLIVVPLAVLVDFEHSYLFPMHASNLVLVVLLFVAWVGPEFFIRREVRNAEGELSRLDEEENPKDVNRRVRQILSIALAHSFMVALIFSFLFESNYVSRIRVADVVHADAAKQKHGEIVAPHNGVDSQFHHEQFFLRYLPREARCDLGYLFGGTISSSSPWKTRLRFEFYPTLILTWTALGLFFGVFLEGFLKGERLRVEMSP